LTEAKITIPDPPKASSKHVRSSMRGNRSIDTKPEMLVRMGLYKLGLRYRVHYRLEGKPDIVFTKKRLAIFIDGCYWHGCPKCYKEPKTNTEYWSKKIARNKQRALTVNKMLRTQGWDVLRIWEHEVLANTGNVVKRISNKVGINSK